MCRSPVGELEAAPGAQTEGDLMREGHDKVTGGAGVAEKEGGGWESQGRLRTLLPRAEALDLALGSRVPRAVRVPLSGLSDPARG